MWMGLYLSTFYEDPTNACSCRWDGMYATLQRHYGVSTNLKLFFDMTKRFKMRRADIAEGAPTVSVVVTDENKATHVCIGSVDFALAKLIFASGQEDFAFDGEVRAEVKAAIEAEAKPEKAAK